MGTFAARYDGRCAECGEWIEAGDLIGFTDDVVVCAECYEDAEEARKPPAAEPYDLG